VVALACVNYGPRHFDLGGQALIYTDYTLGFMVPGKLSSLVTTCQTIPTCFKVVMWRENEVAQDDDGAGRSLGTKISSREQ
jgi:hypothetical protein